MNNKPNCATEDDVCTILCTVPHAIMPSITRKNNFLSFQTLQNVLLVLVPKCHYAWDQKVALMVVVSCLLVGINPHVMKDQKNFTNR